MTNISIINASTVVSDAQVAVAVGALQLQVSRDFSPAWGIDALLHFVPKGQNPPLGSWWLVILDDSDQAGALGYHDVTAEGLPIGKVFAKTDLTYKLSWTVTASHELLEMLADPAINLTVLDGNTLYAYEVADACEADIYGYLIGDVLVSDFVTPAWFEGFRAKTLETQFDLEMHIKEPFGLLPGGYIGVMNINSADGWQQKTAEGKPNLQARPNIGSRRERRRTPRYQWLPSNPKSQETK